MKVDIDLINSKVDRFVDERDWDQFHSLKNLSMALSVETSELVEIFQWLREEDSDKMSRDPKLKAKVEDEVADIFVYLLRIVKKANIDLEKVTLEKIEKNAKKYPVDKAKGSSKKYDDL